MPRKKVKAVVDPIASSVVEVENDPDTDGDGLTDAEEGRSGTSPFSTDTDGDGLSDDQELATGTDPAQWDSDRDGITDGEETREGSDPLEPDVAEMPSEEPEIVLPIVARAVVAAQLIEYSPTLSEMRDWRSNALMLGKPDDYVDRIGQLGKTMLAGTEQMGLPKEQRDPDFRNEAFTLASADRTAMQQDEVAVKARAADQPSQPEQKSSAVASFKHFSRGATLFDQAAIDAAAFLQTEAATTAKGSAKGSPYLKLSAEQISPVKAALADRGYRIEDVENKVAHIDIYGKSSAIVIGAAAFDAAEVLGKTLDKTANNNPKLKVPFDQMDALVQALEAQNYKVQEHPREISYKPRAVFFEGADGESYYLFNKSAQNVAETLNLNVEQQADGRSMMTFDRPTYRALKEQLQTENGFEVSTNDLKATFAVYENDSGKGALVNGTAALVVAEALKVPVKYKDFGEGPLPQVNLKEAQIPQAEAALQASNYRLIQREIDLPRTANIRDYRDNSIVFGKPAEAVAAQLGLEVQPNQNNDGIHLKVPAARRSEAIDVLQEQGYQIRDITPQASSRTLVKAGDGQRPGAAHRER